MHTRDERVLAPGIDVRDTATRLHASLAVLTVGTTTGVLFLRRAQMYLQNKTAESKDTPLLALTRSQKENCTNNITFFSSDRGGCYCFFSRRFTASSRYATMPALYQTFSTASNTETTTTTTTRMQR